MARKARVEFEGAVYHVLEMARRLVEQLPREGRDWLPRLLAGEKAAHKTQSRYQVWQEGSPPRSARR